MIILVILFQSEIRTALERLGRRKFADIARVGVFGEKEHRETNRLIDVLCKTAEDLVSRGEGALIVLEKETKLGDIIKTGTIIDAAPSKELIANLFFKNSPLHDGAMIVRDKRVYAAGCYLPLSSNFDISSELGTRHRAALGISEVSDSITIVISEERRAISIAHDSKLQPDLSLSNLRKYLERKLLPSPSEPKDNFFFKRKEKKNEK